MYGVNGGNGKVVAPLTRLEKRERRKKESEKGKEKNHWEGRNWDAHEASAYDIYLTHLI